MYTITEENYLKAIYRASERQSSRVNTNKIASLMKTSPASVTDMLQKLANKELIDYQKYQGVRLTKTGVKVATSIIRKHRLWEYFLVEKLRFSWADVHTIAEQLEHISSDELIERLDEYLNFPKYDPHGDPIPNADGKFTIREQIPLSLFQVDQRGTLLGVREDSNEFLNYLSDVNIKLGSELKVIKILPYDGTMKILVDNEYTEIISEKVCNKLLLKQI